MKKHLVYLIDGTWMFPSRLRPGVTFTNIHHLNTMLRFHDRGNRHLQILHYSRGLGSGNKYSRLFAGAFGSGIWDDIEEIYLNVCTNYASRTGEGNSDELYFFGFSRGAAIARAVSGLINIGVLKPNRINHFHHIKHIFLCEARRTNKLSVSKSDTEKEAIAREIVESHCYDEQVSIKFLGLFDTVIGGFRYTRKAQELNLLHSKPTPNVKNVVHILAADETREMFRPSPFVDLVEDCTNLEQIWMPGTHCDIGGGFEKDGLSRISLITMVDRILSKTNLDLDVTRLQKQCCESGVTNIAINNERTRFAWRILSPFPKERRIFGKNRFAHEVAKKLSTRDTDIKGRYSNYRSSRLEDLAVCATFTSKKFENCRIRV